MINKEKGKQLGMPFGTACGRLRKMVLFDILRRHKENICFRCGQEILKHEDMTMDHKEAWLHDRAELFWDLSNIAFSHEKCNRENQRSREKGPIKHGTRYGYKRKCRCRECTEANRIYTAEIRSRHHRPEA